MKKLGMLLGRSSRKEKTLLYISYILNVFLIATIIMVVYALRESIAGLSGTDSDQAGMMSAAMILVVVIIVVFFLWLIAMELKSLYDSRMQFNTNVRLTGFSNWKLTMLYLTELLYMQPVSVAAGIVLGELVYHLYAVRAGEILLWIQPQVLAGALGYLVANPANFSVTGFEISPWRFALLFAAWFAVYLAVQLFLVRRETKDGRCVEILRK